MQDLTGWLRISESLTGARTRLANALSANENVPLRRVFLICLIICVISFLFSVGFATANYLAYDAGSVAMPASQRTAILRRGPANYFFVVCALQFILICGEAIYVFMFKQIKGLEAIQSRKPSRFIRDARAMNMNPIYATVSAAAAVTSCIACYLNVEWYLTEVAGVF
jgi:hypothetical protein